MQLPLRGIVTPLATPIAQSKRVEPALDAAALDSLIEHVIGGGVHGIFLLGTTGESSALSREVRQEIVQRACSKVERRVPVLVGISDNAIAESLGMAKTALEAGADALVLAAPCYFQNSQEDLFRYVSEIAARVTLPLFLYNIPNLTKNSFDPETVRQVSELPQVVGLKDSTGDLGYLERTVGLMKGRPDFSILTGPEEILVDCMRRGSIGGVSGGSNLNPRLFVALYNAVMARDTTRMDELQQKVNRISTALYRVGYPGSSYLRGLKAALELAGICRAQPVPPCFPFSSEERAQLEQNYRALEG